MSFEFETLQRGWSAYVHAYGIKIFQSNLLSRAGLHSRIQSHFSCVHGFTARYGGVSLAPYDSLNLAFTRPEPRENVLENYSRLANASGIPKRRMALASYAHGNLVHVVHDTDGGAGIIAPPLPEADGLATSENAALVTLHADCLSVLFFEPQTGVCGACHAGWRGVARGVAVNTLNEMEKLGAKKAKTIAWIGPGICKDCYEVDEPVIAEFERAFPGAGALDYGDYGYNDSRSNDDNSSNDNKDDKDENDGNGVDANAGAGGVKLRKAKLDLSRVMAFQLLEAGIAKQNLELSGLCTACTPDFFSYRRDAGKTGAMAAFIMKKQIMQ